MCHCHRENWVVYQVSPQLQLWRRLHGWSRIWSGCSVEIHMGYLVIQYIKHTISHWTSCDRVAQKQRKVFSLLYIILLLWWLLLVLSLKLLLLLYYFHYYYIIIWYNHFVFLVPFPTLFLDRSTPKYQSASGYNQWLYCAIVWVRDARCSASHVTYLVMLIIFQNCYMNENHYQSSALCEHCSSFERLGHDRDHRWKWKWGSCCPCWLCLCLLWRTHSMWE